MRMDEGLDTGDMISKRTVLISGEDTGGSLTEKLSKAGAELLVETLPGILNGEAVCTPQPACPDMPYVRTIKKEQGRIDWNEDADSICRKVRAYSPWPSAFTEIDGNPFKIWRAHTGRRGCCTRMRCRSPEKSGCPYLIFFGDIRYPREA